MTFQDDLKAEAVLVSAYWQLPGVIFLKLNEIESPKVIYLTCLRSRLGGDTYVSLLSHIIQPETKVELR